jgi:hypothetical protein
MIDSQKAVLVYVGTLEAFVETKLSWTDSQVVDNWWSQVMRVIIQCSRVLQFPATDIGKILYQCRLFVQRTKW